MSAADNYRILTDKAALERHYDNRLLGVLLDFLPEFSGVSLTLAPQGGKVLVTLEILAPGVDNYDNRVDFFLPVELSFPNDDFDVEALRAYVQAHYTDVVDDATGFIASGGGEVEWLDTEPDDDGVHGYVTRPGVPQPLPVNYAGEVI